MHDCKNQGHLWGKWYPYDRTTIRRTCQNPKCWEVEFKDVSKAPAQ